MATKKTPAKKRAAKKKEKVVEEEVEQFQLNQSIAFSRVAVYLEEAGEVAVNSRNIEGMLTVAKGWLDLADAMDSGQVPQKRARLGFAHQEEE
jgi:hypothetical protein